MKKRLLTMVSLLSMISGSLDAATSYFRTPLSFIESRWGTVHYPLPWLDECDCWEIDTLGVYYQRNACKAYGRDPDCILNDCDESCKDSFDKVSRDTVSLSQLWFGKESFCADQIFAGGRLITPIDNPFLPFVKITPNFDYNERGAALALNAVRKRLGCDESWFVGGRVAMPIKVIEVNQRCAGPVEEIKDDFANVIVTVQQQFNQETQGSGIGSTDSREVKGYRLDFLSLMKLPDGTPMVEYGTVGADATTDTRIAGQNITTNETQSTSSNTGMRAPIYAYKQSNGIFPLPAQGLNKDTATFPLSPVDTNAFPMIDADANAILSAAGNGGLADGQYGAFGGFDSPNPNAPPCFINQQLDYAGNLGVDPAAQKQLFIVPVGMSSGGPTWETVGLVVQDTIEYVLNNFEDLGDFALDFFSDRGINFSCSDCSTGAGDTFVEFYGGKMRECWFADGLIGFRFPTGTNYDDPKRIYQQTTGNNGHFATKIGAEGGYMPCEWLGIKLDFFWRHNFEHMEKRAAAFKGALTRNIGPCIDARVKWDDFQFHADFTFFSPKCPDLGWDFGYELYAKTDDSVCFCRIEADDFVGKTEQLDACILEDNTNTQSHKVRGEIFNRWGCFQIFLGGSYIIAGKQVMKETEWHIGMKAYF